MPDETKERFVPKTTCGGSDDGPRGFRYVEWPWDPDPDDETCVADYAFLVRDHNRDVRVVHDHHVSSPAGAQTAQLEPVALVGGMSFGVADTQFRSGSKAARASARSGTGRIRKAGT